MIDAYPLKWPKGWPRTSNPQSSRFSTTLAAALKNVNSSLKLFGTDSGKPVTEIVISSNVSLGQDNPKDTGVAVWFMWDGELRSIPVDRYKKVQENLQVIHFIIESRRTELRHGGLHILRQAFAGFKAIPEKTGTSCWEVLGIKQTKSESAIHAKYKELAKTMLPDAGGSTEAFCQLQEARDAAIQFANQ